MAAGPASGVPAAGALGHRRHAGGTRCPGRPARAASPARARGRPRLDRAGADRDPPRAAAGPPPPERPSPTARPPSRPRRGRCARRSTAPARSPTTPARRCASIRDRLRRQRGKLRTTLEGFLRGKDTAKYLQEQVVTDRHGRYVVVVKSEHRHAIPGLIHGSSASGASLYLEPLATVEINNELVALNEDEKAEVFRILTALTNAFRVRAGELDATIEAATTLDVIQAKARLAAACRRQRAGAVDRRAARADRRPAPAADSGRRLAHARRGRHARRPRHRAGAGRRQADPADARPGDHRARTPAARRSR